MMPFSSPRPFFYLGKIPITVVGILILVQLLGMILCTLMGTSLLQGTSFTAQGFFQGEWWRVLSYWFFTPIGVMPLLGLFFFYQFGMPVEAALGRKPFLMLVLSILLSGPLILMLLYALGVPPDSIPLIGGGILSLALFCAFCVMYPDLPFFLFKVPIKWVALVFFLGTVLSLVGGRAWGMALSYTIGTGLAVWMLQRRNLAKLKIFPASWVMAAPKAAGRVRVERRKKPVKPLPPSKLKPRASIPRDTEIDAILDKISAEGLHSLTAEERTKLEAVSKK